MAYLPLLIRDQGGAFGFFYVGLDRDRLALHRLCIMVAKSAGGSPLEWWAAPIATLFDFAQAASEAAKNGVKHYRDHRRTIA